MAVTFSAKSTAVQTASGVTTLTHTAMTVASGDTALIVVVPMYCAAGTISAMTATWNGVSMALVSGATNYANSSPGSAIFYLANPAAGNNNLVLNWSTTTFSYVDCYAISFKGSGSAGNGIFATGSGTALSVGVTSAAGNQVVAVLLNGDVSGTMGNASGTLLFNDSTTLNAVASYTSGSSTVTTTATSSVSHPWTASGVDIQAVSLAPGQSIFRTGGPPGAIIVAQTPALIRRWSV